MLEFYHNEHSTELVSLLVQINNVNFFLIELVQYASIPYDCTELLCYGNQLDF